MNKPLLKVLIGLALLASPLFAQTRNTATAPLKGTQAQAPGTSNASGQKIPAVVKPPNPNLVSSPGTISGMVSWDTTKIHAGMLGVCQGLQVNAVQGNQLQPNPPVGQTKLLPYQLQGSIGECPFEIDGAPIGVGLTVHYRADANAFTPAVVTIGQSGQFEIPGGTCGGPKGQGRTTVDGIVVCGNTASGVNLRLEPISSVSQPMSATSGQSRLGTLSANSRNLRPVAGMTGPGTISGAVWWETKTVPTNPAPIGDVCNGTGVTAVVHETAPGQKFASSVQVGTTPQWSSLMQSGGHPANILASGSVVGCLFTITGLPLKTDLTVLVNPSTEIFLPHGVANLPRAVGPVGTVNLPGGSCATPPPQPSMLAQFRAPVVYCGNGAYSVNFNLKPAIL